MGLVILIEGSSGSGLRSGAVIQHQTLTSDECVKSPKN